MLDRRRCHLSESSPPVPEPVESQPWWSNARASWRALARRFRRERGAMAGLVVLAAVVVTAAVAPFLSPYDPNAQLDIVALKAQAPSLAHPFGTDPLSRDVLSRVLVGGRVSLAAAVLAVAIATSVGTAYGAVAGYAGGRVDSVMMRVVDACLAIPRVLLLITVLALWGRVALGPLILVLGLTGWFGVSRIVRAEVMALARRDWVAAARALGAGPARTLFRHIIPNVISPVIVSATLSVANIITLEAGLSFLGLGVQPPQASWGSIMQDGAGELRALWWLSVFPGLAILVTVMAVNAVGDGLRAVVVARDS
jgi:peptide/nickel transport system permease protein